MYTTSNEYKKANLEPIRTFESDIRIGTRTLTNEDLISFNIEQSIQQDDTFSIGNTISSCLNLVFLHNDIDTDDKDIVDLKLGLLVNESYEYIPMGIYNISDISSNDTTTTLLCYDNMIKFDIAYSENAENPTLYSVIKRLSELTGVQFGGTLTDYKDYNLSVLGNYSCREILGFIAGVLGANAIINREGKFDFVSISTEPIYNIEKFKLVTKDGSIVMSKNSEVLEVNAQVGFVNADNYYDYTKKNKNYKITKVVNSTELQELRLGSLDENSVYLSMQNPFVNETILKDIYSKLNGLEFLPYSLNWNGDISIDLGDLITVTDSKGIMRAHPVLSQSITFNGALNTVLNAQGETKILNEYTTTTSEENEIARVSKKVVQVEKDAGELYVVVYDEENQSSIRLTEKMLEAITDEINLTAKNINLEGLVTANNNFKILLDGSIESVNGKFTGDITGSTIIGGTVLGSRIESSDESEDGNMRKSVSINGASILSVIDTVLDDEGGSNSDILEIDGGTIRLSNFTTTGMSNGSYAEFTNDYLKIYGDTKVLSEPAIEFDAKNAEGLGDYVAKFNGNTKISGEIEANNIYTRKDWTLSKSNNGYCKLPNGIIVQWGYQMITPSAANVLTTKTIIFPITYPAKCINVQITTYSSAPQTVVAGCNTTTTSSFNLAMTRTNTIDTGFYWFAIGY